MGDIAQELHGMTLLLQRKTVVRRSYQIDFPSLDLPGLPFALGFDQIADYRHRSPRASLLEIIVIGHLSGDHDLQVLQARAIVELQEKEILGVAARPNPPLHEGIFLRGIARQSLYYFQSFHRISQTVAIARDASIHRLTKS